MNIFDLSLYWHNMISYKGYSYIRLFDSTIAMAENEEGYLIVLKTTDDSIGAFVFYPSKSI